MELSELQQNPDPGTSVQHTQCGSVPTLNMASENPPYVVMNKSVLRAKPCLYVTDLALKGYEIHKKKSER